MSTTVENDISWQVGHCPPYDISKPRIRLVRLTLFIFRCSAGSSSNSDWTAATSSRPRFAPRRLGGTREHLTFLSEHRVHWRRPCRTMHCSSRRTHCSQSSSGTRNCSPFSATNTFRFSFFFFTSGGGERAGSLSGLRCASESAATALSSIAAISWSRCRRASASSRFLAFLAFFLFFFSLRSFLACDSGVSSRCFGSSCSCGVGMVVRRKPCHAVTF
ncbi:hypothetical protein C8R47DRAFT_1136625 [Mycena vitilis]|nr:hypothetical protein C8R47DRAFT_1136625 [Mycena vitilis]